MKGIVKWYDRTKKFGFIIDAEDETKEYFVHVSGLSEDVRVLWEGDEVEFDPEQGDKGPIAKNVVLLKKANEKANASEEEDYSQAA